VPKDQLPSANAPGNDTTRAPDYADRFGPRFMELERRQKTAPPNTAEEDEMNSRQGRVRRMLSRQIIGTGKV
jgi:hypothetical protein